MKTLYHGSYVPVSAPLVKLGRDKVDFGKGFYLTKLREQASSWAQAKAERKGRHATPVLSVFNLDEEGMLAGGYRFREFEKYDLEWLEYVVDCRKGGKMQQLYDIVEGGVANDNVIDTVEDYENGILTAEQALGQLMYKPVNHQICILNQDIVDKFLEFVSSEILEREE